MDINNYSYINYDDNRKIIASAKIDDDIITLYEVIDFFQDRFFEVSNEIADILETFDFSDVLLNYDNRNKAYEKAARFYNSLVLESDYIPLF